MALSLRPSSWKLAMEASLFSSWRGMRPCDLVRTEAAHLLLGHCRSAERCMFFDHVGSCQDRTGFEDVFACQWLEAVVSTGSARTSLARLDIFICT